ncbi:MAG: nuclear transport factor 2 family protein [Erythrobacter sp.]|uniref:nuclear transport factor 2 family protein n=1 Tax=Erythrobacter sp. TaxID=1042 RepID=UPI003A8C7057
MDDTDARLRALEDRAQIANLIAAYGPLADTGAGEALARLWVEDGEYDIGGFGMIKGHAALAAMMDSPVHRGLMEQGCAHILSPHRIELSGDSAVAVGYSTVMRRTGEIYEAWRVSANRWWLVRTAAGWRVKRRENTPLNGSAETRSLLEIPDVA